MPAVLKLSRLGERTAGAAVVAQTCLDECNRCHATPWELLALCTVCHGLRTIDGRNPWLHDVWQMAKMALPWPLRCRQPIPRSVFPSASIDCYVDSCTDQPRPLFLDGVLGSSAGVSGSISPHAL